MRCDGQVRNMELVCASSCCKGTLNPMRMWSLSTVWSQNTASLQLEKILKYCQNFLVSETWLFCSPQHDQALKRFRKFRQQIWRTKISSIKYGFSLISVYNVALPRFFANISVSTHVSKVLTMAVCSVDHKTFLVEPQDVVANTGCPPTLHLVLVAEQLLSRRPSTVVQLSVSQDTQESTLTSIHIPHHRHSGRRGERGGREGGREKRERFEGSVWLQRHIQ